MAKNLAMLNVSFMRRNLEADAIIANGPIGERCHPVYLGGLDDHSIGGS